MSQIKFVAITLAALCLLIVAVSSAPTDPEAAASSSTTSATATAPTTPAAAAAQDTSSTASMAVSSAQDATAPVLNTTFTCYNRKVGYYADMEAECKIYHFCMLGDYNGQEMYQRVSYLCLNGTTFDQQALDCVELAKMTAPCAESEKHFEDSNAVLRRAILGKPEMDEHAHTANSTSAATPAASSEAPAAAAAAAASSTTQSSA